jgi:hypothetical protein
MVQDNVNYQRRLIDFKTKDAPIQPQALHEAALQLTGYAEAYEYQFGDRVQDLAVVVIYPTHYTTHHFNPNTHLEEWRNRRIGYSFAQSQSLMGRG